PVLPNSSPIAPSPIASNFPPAAGHVPPPRKSSRISQPPGYLQDYGDTQVEGIDFHETFSPVVKMTTMKTLMAVAVKHRWSLFQLDVNNAFLHGDLDEEFDMKFPPGLTVSASSSVPMGSADSLVILVVYVDDIILTGTDFEEISALKLFLYDQFKIKDLGLLHYFLGIEVSYSAAGVILHQSKFVTDLLSNYACGVTSLVVCPLELRKKLYADIGDPLAQPKSYRCLVGKLNFLTHTRLDLSFVVQHLSQYLQHPCVPHMHAALHLLRYLKGSPGFGLFFSDSLDLTLRVFCDSDWASCPDSRRSITGFYVLLGDSLISWKSKK
ncbi:uncharacterized mitochondrial protein AtMg00810-like, partial [Capsicum annuum]|uniref:uncharacterized mitochondrial protein AtMg00810-like n=1 Tax=Capsicum annuum TaxID=4072 RepID=UPI001FB0537C